MKASEAIERLKELMAQYGDLDICYPDESERSFGPLDADYIDPYDDWDKGKKFKIW